MARNSLSRKDLKNLWEAVGVASWSKRSVLLVAGLTALVILAIGAFSFLITAGSNNENLTPSRRLLPVGSQAPDFSAQTVDGGNVSLGDGGDYRATMLVFFASWCPHCNKMAPIISDLKNEHEDLRVILAGIDGQDNTEKVREFADKYGIDSPAFYDPSVGFTYQAFGYPTFYVIDGSGKIVAAQPGEVPKDVLEGWTEKALGSGGG